MPVKIGDYDVFHNDNVDRGLHYLENLPELERKEMFDHARNSRDQDHHFQAFIDGKNLRYVLIHRGNGKYELRPKG